MKQNDEPLKFMVIVLLKPVHFMKIDSYLNIFLSKHLSFSIVNFNDNF